MQGFIQEKETASVPELIPTATFASEDMQELIHTVLIPWRPQKLRCIAEEYITQSGYLSGELVILRTYYNGGTEDDDKLRGWLEEADPFDESPGGPDNRWWRVPDDAPLFYMGSGSWQGVYSVLPELAVPRLRRTVGDGEDVDAVKARALAVAATRDERKPDVDDYEEAVMKTMATGVWYLLVVDQQAFEDEELGLLFRDEKRNGVREGTM